MIPSNPPVPETTANEAARPRLEATARRIRAALVTMSHRGRAAHLGSALSCVDILVAAYWGSLHLDPRRPTAPDRDRFLLSKGHAAAALYATLAHRGYFPLERLEEYARPGSALTEHPSPGSLPGVEAATGSLGHGLPIGVGLALAARTSGSSWRTCVLLSDGECNEGSVWEAALLAPACQLGNLVAVVDYNKWQATGRTDEVTALSPLQDKWRAFGWDATEVDGHDVVALQKVLSAPGTGRPRAVIAHTVKGKGVSFMEDDNNWHYRIPNAEEVARAHRELGLA